MTIQWGCCLREYRAGSYLGRRCRIVETSGRAVGARPSSPFRFATGVGPPGLFACGVLNGDAVAVAASGMACRRQLWETKALRWGCSGAWWARGHPLGVESYWNCEDGDKLSVFAHLGRLDFPLAGVRCCAEWRFSARIGFGNGVQETALGDEVASLGVFGRVVGARPSVGRRNAFDLRRRRQAVGFRAFGSFGLSACGRALLR